MRQTGVLLPLFSLPGAFGIGDLGPAAYEMADKIAASGVKIWQMLPLNPIGYGHSPYQPYSSSAGDIQYISLEALQKEGLLEELPEAVPQESYVDYETVRPLKELWLKKAYKTFCEKTENGEKDPAYLEFITQPWVFLYAVYNTFKKATGGLKWTEWPEEMKYWPENRALDLAPYQAEIGFEMFMQYEFFHQWDALKAYVNGLGIRLMGDIPFYVGHDSQEVWADKEMFLLDSTGYPTCVAGVPPDYFSATGQRWGNPIYNWEKMENEGFSFFIQRIQACGKLFDMVRIDHFRAFDTYWQVPASCETAIEGEWIEAPGYRFFNTLLPKIPGVEIIAEDLGEMRPEVYGLRDHFEFPGMDVLMFTLTDPGFKIRKNMVAYTGTHDNNTVKGWWDEMEPWQKEQSLAALSKKGIAATDETIADAMIRAVLSLPCRYVIIPVQDLLGLGAEARINAPGLVNETNWSWKLTDFAGIEEGLEKLSSYGWMAELPVYFKSVLDQDRAAVVLCDLHHTIIYMNPAAAENYKKYGGAALLGKNLFACHHPESCRQIEKVVSWFKADKNNNLVFTNHDEKRNRDIYMVALRDDDGGLIGYYEKHEYRNPETMAPYEM